MANTKNLDSKLQSVKYTTSKIVEEINKLKTEGKNATEIYSQMSSKIESALKDITKAGDLAKKSYDQLKDSKPSEALEQYTKNLQTLAGQFSKLESQQTRIFSKAEKERRAILKKQEQLRNQIAQKNKARTKEVEEFETRMAKRRAQVLSDIENRKATEAKAEAERRKAIIKTEEANQIASFKKIVAAQKQAENQKIAEQKEVLRKIAESNKKNTQRVTEFEKRQLNRRAAYYAKKEKQKTAELKKEEERRKAIIKVQEANQIASFKRIVAAQKKAEAEKTANQKAEEAKRRKSDIRGGFNAQFTGRAIGGAIGSLTKYLGLYQLLSIAQRGFQDLTIGSAKRAIEFEKSLGDLSAIVGLTANETKKLSDEIFNVAGSTSFTSAEIAELQKQLGKLGANADEIVKLTRPVALLAQALGEQPGAAGASLKKFLNQFGETTDEAKNFGNAIVGAVNESALSLESLSNAMQYVGPLASQVGLNFQETSAYLGILADNGFTASRAGTGLRAVLAEAAEEGIPFAEFIEKLGKEGLNAAKAFDIFGKRGASAALVLVQNQSEFESLNAQLFDSERLFNANAKQMATTQGQIDLLGSAYNKFSISLGESITQTNFFINLIGILDKEAAGLAMTYRLLSDASSETKDSISELKNSLRTYSDEAGKAEDANMQLGKAFSILRESGEFNDTVLNSTSKELLFRIKQGADLQEALEDLSKSSGRGVLRLVTATRELVNVLKDQAEIEDQLFITKQSQSEELERYKREYRGLLSLVSQGTEVEEEKAILRAQINNDILDKTNEILNIESSGVLTYEQSLRAKVLKEQVDDLNKQLTAVNSLSVSEDTLASQRAAAEKARRDAFKKAVKEIQDRRKAERDASNESAKVETEISKTADKRADVERKRTKEVSDSYKGEAQEIQDLKSKYSEFGYEIDQISEKSEKYSKVLTSDIIEDVKNATSDYTKEIKDLDDKLKSNQITQEEYNAARDAQYETLKANIEAFKQLGNISPEVAAYFDELAKKALEAGYAIGDSAEIAKKTWDDFVRDFEENKLEFLEDAIKRTGNVLGEFSDTQLENTKNRIASELELIKSRYETEDYLAKQQLENGLINEEQYRRKQQQLRKKQVEEENKLAKELFEAEKKQERQDAKINAAVSTAEIVIEAIKDYGFPLGLGVGAALSSIVAGELAGQLSAINQKKFYAKKFEQGGLVQGPSHQDGGIPFTVQGQSGYEMEGGEFIVNKKASALHRQLLESINNSAKPNVSVQPTKFATGGVVNNTVVNNDNGVTESVNYLKAIAEATTSTAIQSSKPVRAFVTSTDLKKDETARRIKENNTII